MELSDVMNTLECPKADLMTVKSDSAQNVTGQLFMDRLISVIYGEWWEASLCVRKIEENRC